MSKELDSAFPHFKTDDAYGEPGMSLLDWFAGLALPGVMQSQIELAKMTHSNSLLEMKTPEATAECAYEIAEAMLAERGRRS